MDRATRERRTPRRMIAILATIGLVAGMLAITAATASASGPLPPGKTVITFECGEPLNASFPVTEPHAFFHAVGLGQVVGEQLHGIPVWGTTLVRDDTTQSLVIDESFVTGNGNAHPNQPTVECIGILSYGAASDFFGTSLPEGVAATDHITVTDIINVTVGP